MPKPTAFIVAKRSTAKQYDGVDFEWKTNDAVTVEITLNGAPYVIPFTPKLSINGSSWTSMPAGDLVIAITATSIDGQTATDSVTVKNTALLVPKLDPIGKVVAYDLRLVTDMSYEIK